MPYLNSGTTKDTAHQPSLYHLRLPILRPAQPVVSITVPNIGSDLTQQCRPSIHVFAVYHSK